MVHIPTAILVASLATGGTVIAAYVDVTSDIRENDTRIEEEKQKNKERYEYIQKQLDRLVDNLIDNG